MKLRRSGRWPQQLLPMGLGALLLALWGGAAVAQTPIKARLSISSPKTGDTMYPGILLPDGSITNYNYDSCINVVGLRLKLEVWIRGQLNPTDVTQSSFFSSVPDRQFSSPDVFYLDINDGVTEQKVQYRGSYTLNEVTVTDTLTVKMKLFKAPRFYDAGGSQQTLLREIDALALAISAFPWSADAQLQSDLGRLRMFVSLWWSGKLVRIIEAVGGRLVDLGAPPELLIQLSQLLLDMKDAGLIRISEIGEGNTVLSLAFTYPPWLPTPDIVLGSCGPIIVGWYGLGR